MKASVIILSFNRKSDTLATIRSLARSRVKSFTMEIIVVDNASYDGSPEAIKNELAKIKGATKHLTKFIGRKENLGFAEGNNVGMRYALKTNAQYIFLLNDDTIIDKNTITSLIESAKENPAAGAISPKIYFAKGYEFHKKRYEKRDLGKVIWYAGGDIDWANIYGSNHGVDEVDNGQYDKSHETDFTTGCCVLYKSEVLRKVGLYDKRYFAYLEDADHSQRIKKAGYQTLYEPKAHLWHKVAQSSGIGSELNDYFLTRNRMLFGLRYGSFRTKLALIKESMKLLLKGRKWQRVGIKDFYLGNFGKGSWKWK